MLNRMPQPKTVTTFSVLCHKAPHGCALLHPSVIMTSMHQCGGTLCILYCRISQTHPSIVPTHCLDQDDSHSCHLASQLSSSRLQMFEMPPCHPLGNMPILSESNIRSKS